jgi:exodeoxyribonuclease VII small subunit
MSATEPSAEPVPVSELSYTQASRELDGIVDFFEQRDVDVDQLVARLERATAIVDELDRRIRQTRSQVEQLVPRLEAAARGHDAGPEVAQVDDEDEDEPWEDDTPEDEFTEDGDQALF